MIDFGLIVARFLHYVAVTTLAGASFFPIYAFGRGEPQPLWRWRQGMLLGAAILVCLSGLLWFVFAVANMSGTLAHVTDPEVLASVLHDTVFGKVWAVRMILAAITIGLIWSGLDSPPNSRSGLLIAVLAAALLISLAGVGHSQVEEGIAGAIHVLSDSAHLLAAGAWLGGLIPLVFILSSQDRDRDVARATDLDQILLRFSGMGYIAVATLVGSGLVNSWYLVGNYTGLLTTQYGQALLAKLVMFAGMLLLALMNRFWLVPSMNRARADGAGLSVWTGRLRNHVLGEHFLGLAILLVVSVLGTMRPAAGQ
jgi:putative copper resistance protein D